jgi:superfamily II DNA helicase RecQ
METLRQWRKVTAAELGVPSDVVLPRDVLNRIAGSGPTNMPELAGLMHDVPYRFNRFGEQILNEIDKGDHHK